MPRQVPLYKLFLIMAVWAIALGVYCRLGTPGLVIAGMVGTAGSGLVIVIRKRQDLVESITVALGSTIGWCIIAIPFSGGLDRPGIFDPLTGLILPALGAIVGGMVASWYRKTGL